MKNNIKKGRLTIYTSYSPGAGKTHIMLRDALQNYGEKVVIGFLNGKERKIKGSNKTGSSLFIRENSFKIQF